LYNRYKTPITVYKQIDQYIKVFLYIYNYKTVVLPPDRSALQPVIPIVDRFQYREYIFKIQDYSNIRKYANQVYSRKYKADKNISQAVQLQL
jgi:hypothetical protein